MTDAFTSLSSQVPDGFGALFTESQKAAAPEMEKAQKAEEEFAKQKGDVMVAKAQEIARSRKAGLGGEAAVYKKYEKELMAPPPTIQYSPDTAQGMQSLAVLLPLAGAMMGGKGQLSGIGAMQAMTGVLEGHKQGNQDRIALEQKNFEQQMQNWKLHQEQVKGAFERALQMAKINASAAQADLEARLAAMDAPLLLSDVKRNGVVNAAQRNLNTIDKMTTMIEQAQTNLYKTQAKGMVAATMGIGPKAQLAQMVGADAAAATDDKTAAATVSKIQGLRSTMDLVKMAQDPEIKFGELGKLGTNVSSFFERNVPAEGVNSETESNALVNKAIDDAAKNAGLSVTDKNVVFYKKAVFTALELERAARGGSLLPYGVMRTLGPLLDPKSMTREAYVGILTDRANEVGRSTGLSQDQLNKAIGSIPEISFGPKAATTPAAPVAPAASDKPPASKEAIEFTAKKYGKTVEEVKQILRNAGRKIEGE
jgi:hypothetical protein